MVFLSYPPGNAGKKHQLANFVLFTNYETSKLHNNLPCLDAGPEGVTTNGENRRKCRRNTIRDVTYFE